MAGNIRHRALLVFDFGYCLVFGGGDRDGVQVRGRKLKEIDTASKRHLRND